MARIRTIKPEICTSSQFVECSTIARLMFVTMLCFFDDGGNHPANVKRLKMEIFPADYFSLEEIQGMMDELINQGLVVEYQAEGSTFWHVTGFDKHQKIDRPNPKYPRFDEPSTNKPRTIDVQSPPEGKGTVKEGKGVVKEVNTSETILRNCITDRQADIKNFYPHVNIEIETEEIVAKFKDKTIGADPWLIVSRWCKNLKVPPKPEYTPSTSMVITQEQRDRVNRARGEMYGTA